MESIAGVVKTMGNITDAVGPFKPFVSIVSTLVKEMEYVYETAQYNKRTCGVLFNRVEAADVACKALMRQWEDNLHNFHSQNYYDSFQRFVNCLKQIKTFCIDISQLIQFKKFVTSEIIQDNFEKLIKEYDTYSHLLNLEISIATNEQMEKDLAILQSDLVEMKKVCNILFHCNYSFFLINKYKFF